MAFNGINQASMSSPMNLLNTNTSSVQAQAQAASTSTSGTSGTSGLDSTTTGTTFLNLLVKELQNQDPTAPMDSTAMVGQMISLNQLDQLISINQVLSSTPTTRGATGKAVTGSPASSSSTEMAQRAALLNSTQNANGMQTAAQAAFDPTQTLDLSNLNIPNGGR